MNVAPGSRLGPYEIVSRIGAGGMGEVWKARDTRLDRSVAIKVLPAEFAQNAQFKIRFEREAKTISQLNHPNICTLYDVGEDYLVMELLEGETLADKIAKGALPLDQALRYGIEIADALDKAHRNGVIHRDLKPANIIITKSRAKLLDFGLAKTSAIVSVDGATIHKPLTQEGTILGTFQYMAPEQLEGEEADARTDIFAFGVLLYEMVTGKRAFEGKTKTSLIASIVSSEPKPISQFQPLTPSALEHVVRKCLAKERDNRWQSAHDIAEELTWISGVGSQEEPITRRESRLLWMALAAAMLVAAASVVSFSLGRSRSPSPGPIRFTFSSPELVAAQNDPEASGFALSQDGKTLAFIGAINGTRHIFLRSLNQFDVRALAGTEGATFPFWSPDGASLGFFAAHKLKTISAGGGEPKTLCDVEFARGGTWSGDGTIVFAANTRSPLYRIAASGGNPVAVTQLDRSASEVSHRWPAFLPDNHHFLFYVMGDRKGTYVGSLDSKERTRVLDGSSNAVYVSPGFLLFASSRALVAQRFDLRRLQVMGDATTSLAEDVGRYGENGPSGYTRFAVSGNGVLAFQRMDSAPTQLIWFNREGKEIGHLGSAGDYGEPRMSPDGSRISIITGPAAFDFR